MSGLSIHVDEAALRLRMRATDVRDGVEKMAQAVASGVRRQGILVGDLEGGPGGAGDIDLPVLVEEHNTEDDASLGIYIAHPAGVAVEATYGALSKAASSQGLKLGAKPAGGL